MAPIGKKQKIKRTFKKERESTEVGSLVEADMGMTEKDHIALDRTIRAGRQPNNRMKNKKSALN